MTQTQELTPRDVGRLSPLGFAAYATNGRLQIPPHLELLNYLLVEVAARRISRLMVFIPPRHGKSVAISEWFPAWYLGNFPDRRVILTAYEANFAKEWGRKARDILEEWGPSFFGVKVRDDAAAANNWVIEKHGGGMMTAGVGGPILGRGADIAIIDDPVKNAEDAQSPTTQQKQLDWFESTLETRLEPGGAIVMLMQRWDRNDLAGQLLAKQKQRILEDDITEDELWNVVELPAMAKPGDILGRQPGEPLWPERYDRDRLEKIRKNRSVYWWMANFQQDPQEARGAGQKFARNWFRIVPSFPRQLRRMVLSIDIASKEPAPGRDPDYTSCALMGEDVNGEFYLRVYRTRQTPKGTEDFILDVCTEVYQTFGHIPIYMQKDPGAAGVTVISHYRRNVLSRFNFNEQKIRGSKDQRISLLSNKAQPTSDAPNGRILLIQGDWVPHFLDQAEAYPTGNHDDDLDASAGSLEELLQPGITNVSVITGTVERLPVGGHGRTFGAGPGSRVVSNRVLMPGRRH